MNFESWLDEIMNTAKTVEKQCGSKGVSPKVMEMLLDRSIEPYGLWKGKYFDKQRNRLMPRCEFLMIEGHAVVDLIHVLPDPAKEIEREKYVENKRRSSMRGHFP